MRDPNFFIIGAPKCGTTALSEYLREHLQIFMTMPKEPNHFSRDFAGFCKYQTDAEYYALYESATDGHVAVGEASTPYLRSRVAVPEIEQRFPGARYVVMLRNPMDAVPAWHSHIVRGLTEDVEDFEQAWHLTNQRRRGQHIPPNCADAAWLDYPAVGQFGEQVERLLQTVDRDRVLFVKFDHFAADAKSVYDATLAFLGVASDHRTDFPRVNERATLRSRRVARLHQRAIRFRRAIGIGDDSPIRKWTSHLTRSLSRMNTKPATCTAPSQVLQQEMAEIYQPDIRKLTVLTGLDLSDWQAQLTEVAGAHA